MVKTRVITVRPVSVEPAEQPPVPAKLVTKSGRQSAKTTQKSTRRNRQKKTPTLRSKSKLLGKTPQTACVTIITERPCSDICLFFQHLCTTLVLLFWSEWEPMVETCPSVVFYSFIIATLFHASILPLFFNVQLSKMLFCEPLVLLSLALLLGLTVLLGDLFEWDRRTIGVAHLFASTAPCIFLDAYRPRNVPTNSLHLLFPFCQLLCIAVLLVIGDSAIPNMHPQNLPWGIGTTLQWVVCLSLVLAFTFVERIRHAHVHPNHFSVLNCRVSFALGPPCDDFTGVGWEGTFKGTAKAIGNVAD